MSPARAALVVGGNDLRRRLRNRSFLLTAIAGPLALAAIITLAFGGSDDFDATFGIVDADGSPLGQGVVSALTGDGADDAIGLDFEAVDTVDDARIKIEDGDFDAAVVIPEGFAASLTTDQPGDLEVLADSDSPVTGDVARSVAGELAARADAGRLAAATATALGGPAPDPVAIAAIDLPVTVEQEGTGGDVSPAAYFGPSMGIFFLFLSLGTVARDLLTDERTGVIDRIRAGPVGAGALLAGKGAAVVVTGVTALCVIWAATTVALGADWGDPAGVVLMIVCTALAVAGIAGLLAALARTEQSADTLATAVALIFALLGGAFLPPGALPDAFQRLAVLTPMGWALRGFAELSAGEGGLADVIPYALVLLAWAGVSGVVAARLLPARLGAR
jgi:ABC-2 type transport system permease protein